MKNALNPRVLVLALSTALLAACGGGGGGGDSSGGGSTGGGTPTPADPYPEPTSAAYDEVDLKGFYDIDASGATRAVRNDLEGTLPAMIQFAQSHTIDPSGNEAKNMPRLTTERAALLLVTPDPSLKDVDAVKVTVSVDGTAKGTLELLHPNAMYRSDYNNGDGRPDYNYSRRAWSVELPWDWVKPGMSLSVSDSRSRSGSLAADKIDFGAPAELVVHNIRLGMLTDPPAESDAFWLLKNPEQGAADYFQTIPAARFTVAYYEPMKLDKVMVANGTIYDTASSGEGGVYSGDMRENTGKSTVSVGINLANFGATASGMAGQSQPQWFQNVVAHHAVGRYSNGVQSHGLSGGNGMLTLYSTSGNEFSHEIGHHYGLGHYPGQSGDNYFLSGHHHDSGWGYIAYRKRMRGNLHWNRAKTGGLSGMPIYDDTYSFATDAMAGGNYSSALSRYTHYTGYSTRIAIQPRLDKPVPTQSASTGYLGWNADTRKMEPVTGKVPNNSQLFFNSPDGNYLKPRLVGTEVFTVLGGYDPDTGNALLYPAFRGNWGNVFDLPAPVANASNRQCWLEVGFSGGGSKRIAVAGNILQNGSVNKLHINLAQADKPQQASLQCQAPGAAVTTLASMSFPQNLAPMKAPVVVGKEAGYSALRAVELPELETLLVAAGGKPLINLGARGNLLYASWGGDATGLSSQARQVRDAYIAQETKATRLNRWMNRYRTDLQASNNTAAVDALKKLLDTLGLRQTPLLPVGQQMLVTGNKHCLKTEDVDGKPSVYIAQASSCTGADNELWMADLRGAIHSVANPTLCLSGSGGNNAAVTLARCDRTLDAQMFDLSGLPRILRNTTCLDLSGGFLTNGRGKLITYNCTGGGNQQWTGLSANDNALLALLSPNNLVVMRGLNIQ
ncbi:M66 family metalloprotease [Stenotrophomonas sp.]|uniref:M66 family metalloprotease n=1 Tax=Stenotrophomonas sp. TaxID=69392 RepID=UPI0028AE9626|nr:M66 family metalloprotease [Stenotrophomonas sp.]